MSIEAALYDYLSNQSTITDLVSTRIYPHHLPQGITYPAITFTMISNIHVHNIQGGAGITTARIQVDSWASSLSSVVTVAEALRQELQGYSGTWDTTTIHFVLLDQEQNLHEAPIDGSSTWLYRKSQDFLVKYKESIPSH